MPTLSSLDPDDSETRNLSNGEIPAFGTSEFPLLAELGFMLSDQNTTENTYVETSELNAETTVWDTDNKLLANHEPTNEETLVDSRKMNGLKPKHYEILLENNDFLNAVGEMTILIIKKQFPDYICVGVITEENADILNYIPDNIFKYHIHNARHSGIQETNTLNPGKLNDATLKFESLLINTFNAGCPLFVIQVTNPKAVVNCLARSSRRAEYRMNRQYLFLPSPENKTNMDDIFSMKEMDYMPDVVIAKIIEADTQSENSNNTQQNNKYDEEGGRFSVNGSFKIELRSHAFKGLDKTKINVVDIWKQGEGFRYSANIFPDKTKNVEGKKLVLVTFYYPPFNVFNMKTKPPLYDGIEFRVATEYISYVNATFR